jgi:hypothetical protein
VCPSLALRVTDVPPLWGHELASEPSPDYPMHGPRSRPTASSNINGGTTSNAIA